MIYGTAWKGDRTADLVLSAFDAGFRAFDTAAQPHHYREDLVGTGIRTALARRGAKREDLYIQTKFMGVGGQVVGQDMPYDPLASITEQVRASIIGSLHNLAPDEKLTPAEVFLDCLILHAPFEDVNDNILVWAVFEECVPHTVRRLGIANVQVQQLVELCDRVRIQPAVVQNAFHSKSQYDIEIRSFCAQRNITYQAFWTLTANPQFLSSEIVASLASSAGVGRAVALYYLIEQLQNVVVLNGTTQAETMASDLREMATLEKWAANGVHAEEWALLLTGFRALVGEVPRSPPTLLDGS